MGKWPLLAALKKLQLPLEEDQHETSFIADLPDNKQSHLLDEIRTLEQMVEDGKLALLEFIPTYFKAVALGYMDKATLAAKHGG